MQTSLYSYYICWQRGSARIRPPLLQQSSDISCPLGSQQQTCSSGLLLWARAQMHGHYNNHLTASFPGQPGWAGTRKVKPIWILLEQETVSGSGISWATCKSAPRSRQITTSVPHHSVFYRPDALPAAQPTVSKHWRHMHGHYRFINPAVRTMQAVPIIYNEENVKKII